MTPVALELILIVAFIAFAVKAAVKVNSYRSAATGSGLAVNTSSDDYFIKRHSFNLLLLTTGIITLPDGFDKFCALYIKIMSGKTSDAVQSTSPFTTATESTFEGSDIIINYAVTENPYFSLVASGFRPGQYLVDSLPGLNGSLVKLIELANKYCRIRNDSTITTEVEVYGQADAIPVAEHAKYNDQEEIVEIPIYSYRTGQTTICSYLPGQQIKENEDFGRFRSIMTYRFLKVRLHSKNIKYHLSSDVSQLTGSKERKIGVRIVIKNILKFRLLGKALN